MTPTQTAKGKTMYQLESRFTNGTPGKWFPLANSVFEGPQGFVDAMAFRDRMNAASHLFTFRVVDIHGEPQQWEPEP
jgi:hypothetical protein